MKELQKVYSIKDPRHTELYPELYLGAFCTGSPPRNWTITAKNYIKEALEQIEKRTNIKIREEKCQ